MRKDEYKIGTKVKYYPYPGIESKAVETYVTSEPINWYGIYACNVSGIFGRVDIEHLVII